MTVACSIVGSRLDYCNAMLYGAPAATLDVLQRAQNNLAKVVCQRGGRTDARPLLRSLHWLPVKHRVTYKMAALTFKTMSSSTPTYLNDLIQTAVPVRPLRSSDAPLLIVPKTRTEFARRSFSVVAPHTCNSLPSDVRSCRTVDTFKRHLKSQDPSFQTVLIWCHQRLCIFGLYGAIQMLLLLFIIIIHSHVAHVDYSTAMNTTN